MFSVHAAPPKVSALSRGACAGRVITLTPGFTKILGRSRQQNRPTICATEFGVRTTRPPHSASVEKRLVFTSARFEAHECLFVPSAAIPHRECPTERVDLHATDLVPTSNGRRPDRSDGSPGSSQAPAHAR